MCINVIFAAIKNHHAKESLHFESLNQSDFDAIRSRWPREATRSSSRFNAEDARKEDCSLGMRGGRESALLACRAEPQRRERETAAFSASAKARLATQQFLSRSAVEVRWRAVDSI
jgi:hypothetical protein